MRYSFVPGLPVKRHNPCVDPMQGLIPHVVKSYCIEANGKIKRGGFAVNVEDYPEFEFIIQQFIDNIKELKEKEK